MNYSGAQALRSYVVNYGTMNCQSGNPSTPCYISVELLNYGTLTGGYGYIYRGSNYGTLQIGGILSFIGSESTDEYFSFEPGTQITGSSKNISIAGLARWNAPDTVHSGNLNLGSASGGYSSAGSDFRVDATYSNTVHVTLVRGSFTVSSN